jgi:hypothetical protein
MDVTPKRLNTPNSDAHSGTGTNKKHRHDKLSSNLDGKYWERARNRRRGLGSWSRSNQVEPPANAAENSLNLRPLETFEVGLPVVFGQHQPECPVLHPYGVEEPESHPQSPVHQRALPAPQSVIVEPSTETLWDFTPCLDALLIGSRNLTQTLAFPIKFARYPVNVAPETRRQARQLEAPRREQEAQGQQQLSEQWHREHREREDSLLSDQEDLSPLRIEENKATEGKNKTGSMPGPSSWSGPSVPTNDGNQLLLQQFQTMIAAQMAALRLELGPKKPDEHDTRKRALAAEKQSLQMKIAAIDAESDMIQKGEW